MYATKLPARSLALAKWARRTSRSSIQDMLAMANRPDVTSFALGLPAADLFPVQDYAWAAQHVLETEPLALQYSLPCPRLKTQIVELMKQRGVTCHEEQIFLTTGAQQGINLLSRLLLDQGGLVLCEEYVYTGFQQAIEPFLPSIMTVPTDSRTGMDVALVERILRDVRPAFIYVIADGHNPLSVSMSLDKRIRLTELARHYGVPIIEDDPYGFINYNDKPNRPLRAYDPDWVFYIGTFSKILAPALRVGWIIVPEELTERLSIIKESSDINTCTFNQRAISAYINAGLLEPHTEKLRREYGARRGVMLEALEKHFPSGTRWYEPDNGLFVWVELPEAVDTAALLKYAVTKEGVAFVPGQSFSVRQSSEPSRGLRLNFSNSSSTLIKSGVTRLAHAVNRFLSDAPRRASH